MPNPPSAPNPKQPFNITDLLGIGKVWEKLPFDKLTKKQAYCFGTSVVLLVIVAFFVFSGKTINGFPTAWDLRVFSAAAIIIIWRGISQ